MKKIGLFTLVLGIGLTMGFLLSCNTGTNDGDKDTKKELTLVGQIWYVEAINPAYWNTLPNHEMYITMGVVYSENYKLSDFSKITITNPNEDKWSSPIDEDHLDTTNKTIIIYRCYSNDTPYSIRLGDWTVAIEMSDGTVSKKTITVNEPSTTIAPTTQYVSSQDTFSDNEVYTIAQANYFSATKNASNEITIKFTAADSRINNAYIWFYNSAGDYLGTTGYFKNATGSLQNGLLDKFAVDSTVCTVTLNQAIVDAGSFSFDKATILAQTNKYVIVTTDGAQYSPKYTTYDYRTISAKIPLTTTP